MIDKYVGKFMGRFMETAMDGEAVDIVRSFNFTIFDVSTMLKATDLNLNCVQIMSDLAFGEPLNLLE